MRELMRSFDGRSIDGALLGLADQVSLPRFASVAAYERHDIEVDVLAEDGEQWAVEIKWQNEPATRKDLAAFWDKIQRLPQAQPQRLWFIARAGFRDSTLRFARAKGVASSSQKDLQSMAEQLGVCTSPNSRCRFSCSQLLTATPRPQQVGGMFGIVIVLRFEGSSLWISVGSPGLIVLPMLECSPVGALHLGVGKAKAARGVDNGAERQRRRLVIGRLCSQR